MFASDNPDVAGTYAYTGSYEASYRNPNIMPVELHFRNPIVYTMHKPTRWDNIIPPEQFRWSPGVNTTDDLARFAKAKGYDGVVVRNVRDDTIGGGPPSTVYIAVAKNTVRSPLTGKTIMGLLPATLAGGALVGDPASLPVNAP